MYFSAISASRTCARVTGPEPAVRVVLEASTLTRRRSCRWMDSISISASRRPMAGAAAAGYNIWVVDRAGETWSAPHALPPPINGRGSVFAPVLVRDGSLYFVAGDPPHVMAARRQGDGWAEPTPAGADDEPGSAELSGYVDPDERYLIVTVVGRTDAFKTAEGIYDRADLYMRSHGEKGWSALRHLPAPINTGAEEGSPFVSPDRRYLYFTSERGVFTEHGTPYAYGELERALHAPGNGLGDINRIDARAIGIERPVIFGEGVISTSDDEFGGSFTPDGDLLIFFCKPSAPHSYPATRCSSHTGCMGIGPGADRAAVLRTLFRFGPDAFAGRHQDVLDFRPSRDTGGPSARLRPLDGRAHRLRRLEPAATPARAHQFERERVRGIDDARRHALLLIGARWRHPGIPLASGQRRLVDPREHHAADQPGRYHHCRMGSGCDDRSGRAIHHLGLDPSRRWIRELRSVRELADTHGVDTRGTPARAVQYASTGLRAAHLARWHDAVLLE